MEQYPKGSIIAEKWLQCQLIENINVNCLIMSEWHEVKYYGVTTTQTWKVLRGRLNIFHTPSRIIHLRDKVTWELDNVAEIVDDPAICGYCLINFTNYKDPLLLLVISLGLELE